MIEGGINFRVPERTLLLIYKLKASWDRTYRLEQGNSKNPLYLQGKVVKDGSDVLALIDPDHGGTELDLNYLGQQFEELEFLRDHFATIPEQADSVKKYGRMDHKEARGICDSILSLVKRIR